MTYQERAIHIMEIVEKNKIVSFKNLLLELNIAPATLRRDLTRLENDGKLVRFHGGVKVVDNDFNTKYFEENKFSHLNEKKMIAKSAATLINSHDTVFLDSGTSIYSMVSFINDTSIKIFTNSLITAYELSKKGMNVNLIGGQVQNSISAIFGDDSVNMVKRHIFDKCFLTATSISKSSGFSTVFDKDAIFKKAVLKKSRQKFVIAYNEKFECSSHFTFAKPQDAIVITNLMPENLKNEFSYMEVS